MYFVDDFFSKEFGLVGNFDQNIWFYVMYYIQQ